MLLAIREEREIILIYIYTILIIIQRLKEGRKRSNFGNDHILDWFSTKAGLNTPVLYEGSFIISIPCKFISVDLDILGSE